MRPLLFIRHAESEMNAAGRWQGQADPPLSALGREQAERLAKALAEDPSAAGIERIVTSDLRRAAETAAAVGRALGIPPEPHPDLRETDVGAWSGLPHAEIEARWPDQLARFLAGDDRVRPGGGESRAMLRARVMTVLSALAGEGEGALAVVTHLGVMRSLRPGLQLGNAESLWWEGALRTSATGAEPGREEGVL